jgi:putative transport protein
MTWLADALRAHPELALFLTLGLGHALGRLRIGRFQLSAVIGVLVAGVAIGQLAIPVPAALQWAFFVLFLFAIGVDSGPQFFRGLGRSALPQVGLSLLLCGTALAAAYAVSLAFGFDAGGAAGLLAGAMNASAAIGTGSDAIAKLEAGAAAREALAASLTVAFAVTYLVGLLTEILALAKLGPRLMGVDLPAECRALEGELGVGERVGVGAPDHDLALRAYSVPAQLRERTVAALEAAFAPARVFAERARIAGELREVTPATELAAGDVVLLSGRLESLVDAKNPLRAREVDDPELLDLPRLSLDVVVTRREAAGHTLGELAQRLSGEGAGRGVFVRGVVRAGHSLPVGLGTRLERGDVLGLVGARRELERVAELAGTALWPSAESDWVAIALAIALGGLVGLPAVRVAGLDVGLSMPVGVLLGGLVVGWLRALRPGFARIPDAALAAFQSLGLTGFLAVVGLGAGPSFVSGLASSGVPLVAAGVIVCLVPNVVTILVGRYLLRMHPGVLLGVCAGAGTSPAGLAAVQDEAESRVPTLGYGVSYAVGNVLLALWGSVLVALLAK